MRFAEDLAKRALDFPSLTSVCSVIPQHSLLSLDLLAYDAFQYLRAGALLPPVAFGVLVAGEISISTIVPKRRTTSKGSHVLLQETRRSGR